MAKPTDITAHPLFKPVVYAGLGYLGYKTILTPLLEGLNLKDTPEEKAEKELLDKVENLDLDRDYFNPNFYSKPPSGHVSQILTTATAEKLATQIYNAKSRINDDESAIYAAFRACQYKTQVSYLVYWFNRKYAVDLYSWLKDKVLNDEEMAKVLNITEKLPYGFRNTSTNKITGVGNPALLYALPVLIEHRKELLPIAAKLLTKKK